MDVGKRIRVRGWGSYNVHRWLLYTGFLTRLECLGEKSFAMHSIVCVWRGFFFVYTGGEGGKYTKFHATITTEIIKKIW